jgi:hypothetical protein
MFNPIKAILGKMGYHKIKKVKKFTREDTKGLKREMWDDVVEPLKGRPSST